MSKTKATIGHRNLATAATCGRPNGTFAGDRGTRIRDKPILPLLYTWRLLPQVSRLPVATSVGADRSAQRIAPLRRSPARRPGGKHASERCLIRDRF